MCQPLSDRIMLSNMRLGRRALDVCLAVLFAASLIGLVLAAEDSFARAWLCSTIGHCPVSSHAAAWNKILYDLSVGTALSVFFYGLVVRLPEYERRQRIKRSFAKQYRNFREDCIAIMLGVINRTYSIDQVRELVQQEAFRTYFKAKVSSDQDRWDRFHNELQQHQLDALRMHLEHLREEINFVLASVDLPSEEISEFLKRLSRAIASVRNLQLGYDDTKQLGGFLWSVFAGWSVITGYRERDIIQEMIDAI